MAPVCRKLFTSPMVRYNLDLPINFFNIPLNFRERSQSHPCAAPINRQAHVNQGLITIYGSFFVVQKDTHQNSQP